MIGQMLRNDSPLLGRALTAPCFFDLNRSDPRWPVTLAQAFAFRGDPHGLHGLLLEGDGELTQIPPSNSCLIGREPQFQRFGGRRGMEPRGLHLSVGQDEPGAVGKFQPDARAFFARRAGFRPRSLYSTVWIVLTEVLSKGGANGISQWTTVEGTVVCRPAPRGDLRWRSLERSQDTVSAWNGINLFEQKNARPANGQGGRNENQINS